MKLNSLSSRSLFAVIGCGFLLTQLSVSFISPTFPLLVKYFKSSSTAVKLLVSLFFTGYAIGQLIWGTLSDRYGRRLMWRTATQLYVLSALFFSFSHHLWLLYIFYSLIGFAASAYTSVGNAMLKDLYQGKQHTQIMAIIGVIMASGPSLGALTGSLLAKQFGHQAPPLLMSLYSVTLLIALYTLVPETKASKNTVAHHSPKAVIKKIITKPAFISPALQLSLAFGTLMSFMTVAPFIFHNLMKLNVYHTGLLMTASTLFYILGALFVLVKIKTIPRQKMIQRAYITLLLANVILVVIGILNLTRALPIMIIFSILLLSLGMLLPLCKSACMQSLKNNSGTTASVMKFTQTGGAILMTFICSFSQSRVSILPLALLLMISSALVACLAFHPRLSTQEIQ